MGAATLGGVAGFVALGPLAAVVAGAGVAIQAARAKDDSILRGKFVCFCFSLLITGFLLICFYFFLFC